MVGAVWYQGSGEHVKCHGMTVIGSLLKDSSGMCVFPTTWGDDGLG